jgi:signal transduction histidine kinase
MTFAEQAVFIPRQRGEIRVHDLADPQLQVREEVREYLRRRGIRTSVVVPMHLGDDLRGALLLCFVRAPSLSPEEAGLVHAFANQVVLAMELTRLSQVERAAAVAEERNRLARDMHDTIAQQLAAIVRQLEVVASSDSPAAAMRHVSVATEIARDGLVDVRRSIRALRPSSLDGRTLEGALRDVAEKIMRVAPAAIRVDATEERAAVPHEVEDELFGVVHEAIVNAVKHGAARTVDVEVAFEEGSVRVAVRDDGAGFDVGNTPAGVGLSSMQERARRIGAALTIASEPGSGSEVLVFWSGNAR